MKETQLSALVSALSPPPIADAEFSAIPIPSHEPHRIAMDGGRNVCLLITASETECAAPAVNIVLELLEVEYGRRCQVVSDGGREAIQKLTIVRCRAQDAGLVKLFLDVCDVILTNLGPSPTTTAVSTQFQYLAELFKALRIPPTKTVQGLWGELVLIVASNDSETLARAWHPDPMERYDFASGTERIEVKTSRSPDRKHHFSLEQLDPPIGSRLCVVSLQVDKSGGGSGISELLAELRRRLSSQTYAHVYRTVVLTLGTTFPEAAYMKFDVERAIASIQLYRSENIPRVPAPLPASISNVRFVADLAEVGRLRPEDVGEGGLFSTLRVRADGDLNL